ncbi:MAG TPA: SPOR domain-containing protein [Oligoflexia bacterium]|nr:SPOR domain-containing protein [Oligoflexia bacterium]
MFNKKEIVIILLLFVLVALLSFTLGVRMGRSLNETKLYTETPQEAPLKEKAALPIEKAPAHGEDQSAHDNQGDSKSLLKKESATEKESAKAEDLADGELQAELTKSGVKTDRPVSMELPTEKKGEMAPAKSVAGRFTLQVGSHRTVSEAAEQVTSLKAKGLDAFYIEAVLPGKGTWYRVGVGNFDSKEKAELYAARYKNELPPFIVQRMSE